MRLARLAFVYLLNFYIEPIFHYLKYNLGSELNTLNLFLKHDIIKFLRQF